MTDANPPWRDAEGEGGPGPRSEEPGADGQGNSSYGGAAGRYDEYGNYVQYGQQYGRPAPGGQSQHPGQSQQTGQYGSGGYGGQYGGGSQGGQYGGQYQQQGQYDTGRQHTGEFQRGQYDTGEFQPGQYDTGEFQTGQYPTGQYPTGRQYPGQQQTGQYDTGQYDTGEFQRGQYDTGEIRPGQYDTGEFQRGQYDTGEIRPGQYDTGEIRPGQYGAGQGATGPYGTGTANPGQYQQQPGYGGQDGYGGSHPGSGYGGQDQRRQPQGYAPGAAGQQDGYPEPAAAAGPAVPRQKTRPAAQQRVVANPYAELADLRTPDPDDDEPGPGGRPASAGQRADSLTEQFAFVDDEEEDEEVIDWLKFAETRSERRDERRRRLRGRAVSLGLVLVLVLVGAGGYLAWKGKLPFVGSKTPVAAGGAQKRDVIVVHLMELGGKKSSTALLVNNETTKKGSTLLLPNALAVGTDDASSTTLGKSVEEQGAGPTRDALSTLLGADIKGTWRLDTPFLEVLVESVGGISVTTDTDVPGTGKDKGKTLVKKGAEQPLNGASAVAYATYRGPGETVDKQLSRFGQVMRAVLERMPTDAASATQTVQSVGAVADPSLSDNELGATLAPLAEDAKTGAYSTSALPVSSDGTLDVSTTKGLVKNVLGGAVKNTDPTGTPRVNVRDATGSKGAAGDAQVALVNAGYTFVSGGKATAQPKSVVEYQDVINQATADEVAQTLGLPKSAVKKGQVTQNSDVAVVLGGDYQG